MNVNLVLCGNPFCLIVVQDGLVYYRRPNLPDEQVTDTTEVTTAFLESARWGHGALRVVDTQGNFSPGIPPGIHHPRVQQKRLDSGEAVFEMLPEEMSN